MKKITKADLEFLEAAANLLRDGRKIFDRCAKSTDQAERERAWFDAGCWGGIAKDYAEGLDILRAEIGQGE